MAMSRTDCFVILTFVMILPPPDLPFAFELIARRILKQWCPSDTPISGWVSSWEINCSRSFFRERYFFASALAWRSKVGVEVTLKLTKQLSCRTQGDFASFGRIHFFNRLLDFPDQTVLFRRNSLDLYSPNVLHQFEKRRGELVVNAD